METKILKISDATDEIQLLDEEGKIIGAGSWDKPYDLDTAVNAILQVAMGRYATA